MIVAALSRPGERLEGHLTLAFATGVLVFGLAMLVLGFAGALRPATFFALPLGLLGLSARQVSRDVVRFVAPARANPRAIALSPFETIAFAAGGVALLLIYLPTLVPANTAYDVRWYHLVGGALRRAGGDRTAAGRSGHGHLPAARDRALHVGVPAAGR